MYGVWAMMGAGPNGHFYNKNPPFSTSNVSHKYVIMSPAESQLTLF